MNAPARTQRPPFTSVLADDTVTLQRLTASADAELSALPAKAVRDARQQRHADVLLEAARDARRAFLALHTEAVYDLLTDHRARYVRLPELLATAAERFPGLVPTRAQLDAEAGLIQAHREGRAIDQAILCGALLRSPAVGAHLIDAMLLPTPRSLDALAAFRETGHLALPSVTVERAGTAAHVTFRNAHCLNAEDDRLIADLEVATDLVLLDDQVRVGVVRGGPVDHPKYQGRRVFSAGINLKDLRNGTISFAGFLLGRELGYLHKMQRGLLTDPAAAWSTRTVQKPWVGAVDTFAIGGGMQVLLVLDRVIVETDAFLSLPAAEEGIVPGLGNLRLSRLTGARLARQVVLSGRRIRATDPEAALLCDEVVPAEAMDEAVERAVRELSTPAVAANRRMLALAEEPLDLFRTYLAEFAVVQAHRIHSQDVLDKVERRWQRSLSR
ncbi:enoyl-CoA hydratase/isomerase family protein [Streptomyces luomodiensis]|uniref:Enoyl-CoA hydratase/isomerase family protein n=1 Tax=Streptomyces luomodiensis TaxID=3026192 RepID=A0ABY9VGE7_9ACTN|nr:(3,5-dihydroxyphenyl)acetyl-CoA 1,2-dioxygenase DpgC [Streptomyces sp. SCA4-21]WNF01035.1 enoyl-CoA hydratase/isomerase family protein [Streptomyces sp. SCA4-21]